MTFSSLSVKKKPLRANLLGLGLAHLVLALVLLFAVSSESRGQGSQDATSESELPEEVIVYGKKSIIRLRFELQQAEESVFELFNSLNSNDEFDIHCRKETNVGSRIKHRICEPNFARSIRAQSTAEWLNSGQANAINGQPFVSPTAQIREKERELQAEMKALVLKHPEFLNAVSEYEDARQAMRSAKGPPCESGNEDCL